jgi:hypothetical protein
MLDAVLDDGPGLSGIYHVASSPNCRLPRIRRRFVNPRRVANLVISWGNYRCPQSLGHTSLETASAPGFDLRLSILLE